MEIHRDPEQCKENEKPSKILSAKRQPEVGTALQYPRTPLVDVKNNAASVTRGSSRKHSIDSHARQDTAYQQLAATPRRQEWKSKSRKSCFALFNVPEDLNTRSGSTVGITLPQTTEDEPENVTFQSQMLSGYISVLDSASTCAIKPRASKSDEIRSRIYTPSSCASLEESDELGFACEVAKACNGAVVEKTEQSEAENESARDASCSHVCVESEVEHVDSDSNYSSECQLGHEDNVASTVAETDYMSTETDHILAEAETDNILDEAETDNILAEAETDHILDEAETDNILDEAETDNILDEAETDNILDEAETDNILDEAETDNILDEAETDNILDEADHSLAGERNTNMSTSGNTLGAGLYNMSLDHPYSVVVTGNRSSILQSAATPGPAELSTPHCTEPPHDNGHSLLHFSTPKQCHNTSACHDLVTPLLSSPFELMNVSDSSFKDERQKTDVTDLMQAYLSNNFCSGSEELSFSAPAASQSFDLNSSVQTEFGCYQDNLKTYSANKSLPECQSDDLECSASDSFRDHVEDEVVARSGSGNDFCELESGNDELNLENHLNHDSVSILSNEVVMFIANKTSEDTESSACGTTSFQDIVHQNDSIIDSYTADHTRMMLDSCKEHCALSPAVSSFESMQAVTEQTEVSEQTAAAMCEQTTINMAATVTEQATGFEDVSSSVYRDVDISESVDSRSTFMDYPRIVGELVIESFYKKSDICTFHQQTEVTSAATNTSILEQVDVSILTDHQQTEVTSAVTNTSILEQVDVSILTDHQQTEVTSAATNTSILEQVDVSILTDHQQTEVTSAATNTSILEQVDVSILTDHQQTEVTSAVTNTSILEQVDVSILTDHQQTEVTSAATNTSILEQVDVSILTDNQQTEVTSAATNTSFVEHQHELVNTSMVTEVTMATNTSYGIDVSMVTECVAMFDNSTMAVPEYLTQETMTEQTTMVDTESSMTPLKPGKQCKRFTAEEIRRQHPRIVANHLETLMASNQRLEKEVGTITQERDRLKAVLLEARSKLASTDKQLIEEKGRQGDVISVIEQCHRKTIESLEYCVKDKQDRIEQLELEVRDVRQKYDSTQQELKSSSSELQEKCALLEKLTLEAERHLAEEIVKLQTQFEENNYHRAFLASQQVVRELQAEKEEFELLFDDIDHSVSLQSRLQDSIFLVMTKSQKAVKEHASVFERLVKENQTIFQECTAMQADLEVAMSENRDMHEDVQNLNDILQSSTESYTALKEMYQIVCADLDKSQVEVTELNSKVEFGFKFVKDLMQTKADMAEELTQLQDTNSLIGQSLESSKDEILNLQQQLDEERQLGTSNIEKYEALIADYKASKSNLELTVESLRTTLDSWEVDRDVQEEEIKTYQELVDSHRAKMEEMSNELKALRKIKALTQTERGHFQELKNTYGFLEAEKQLYSEAVTDYRTKLEAELGLAASNHELIVALRSNNLELQKSNEQLASDIQILEDALSLNNMDNDMSWAALENLQDRMESCLAALQQKCNQQVKQVSPSKANFSEPRTPASNFCEGSSLVAQVLYAVKAQQQSPNTPEDNQGISDLHISTWNVDFDNSSVRPDTAQKPKPKQSNLHYGALHPRGAEADALLSPDLSASSQMLFPDSQKPSSSTVDPEAAAVSSPRYNPSANNPSARKDISKLYSQHEQNTSTTGFAKICSIPSTIDRTLLSMSTKRGNHSRVANTMRSPRNSSSKCLESESALSKVKVIDRLLSLILKTVDMAEIASRMAIKDLEEDFGHLNERLRFQRCQYSDLENDLMQKSAQLIAAQSQIKDQNTRINGMTKAILKFQDEQLTIMRLEEDKADLNRKLRGSREEVTLLSGQLEEIIKKLDGVKSGDKSEGVSLREIVSLKKKNHELIMKLFDERDKNKEVGEKAIRRIKILEDNWRKAEAEVCRLDELIENIRETCVRSHAQLTQPTILQVVRLIDGIARQTSTETPNKTTR